ncbi:MAG TPA: hypothetical protein ENF57_00555 [Candidatus Korarchaeota archaeon]|nr:hypothetical protein [Candidatus Korarchaeota archaeon]
MLVWLALIAAVLSIVLSELLHRVLIPRLVAKGFLSKDVHKIGEPLIPEPAGPAVSFSFLLTLMSLAPISDNEVLLLGIAASAGLASLIGLVDDISPLSARVKPALLVIPALILMATGSLVPRPLLPILGRARLYYVYWLVLMAMFTVFSNAVNMMDALNGMLPSSVYAATLPLVPILLVIRNSSALIALSALLGSLLPYYLRNRYPAKVFGGDSNSLFVGAALASIAAVSNTEAFFGISLLPFMVSGFSVIVSVGGLRERSEIRKRPVIVEDGRIMAEPDPRSPMSLIAILTSDRPKTEPDIVKEVALTSLLSGLLSCFTFFLLTPR